MIEEKDYTVLESKIRCAKCGSRFSLENDDGELILRCMGSNECPEDSCSTPVIIWDDLADAVNSVSTIVDLHLDFLWEIIEDVEIDGYNIVVTMEEIIGERRSQFLRVQDYWLVHHSLQGDLKAKEILYSIHKPLVKRKMYYIGRNSSLNRRDLEDLEQAIWLRAFRLLASYNGKYRFWTWMKLLIKAEFHRMHMRQKKEIASDDAIRIQHETRGDHGKSNIDRWVDNEHVNELLSVLNDRERYVVIEYLFNGWRQKDMAVEMRVCRQKVSEVYRRALRKMKKYELSNGGYTNSVS